MNLNTNSDKSADQWMTDYCDGRKASEFDANLTLVEHYKAVDRASWMDPAPKRAKPSLMARVLRFLGV